MDLDIVTPARVRERPGLRVHRLAPADPQLLDLLQQADLLCLAGPTVTPARGC